MTLDIVFTQNAFFSPILNMPRLIYLEPEIDISEFTVGYKLDLAKFWEYDSGERKDEICISSMFRISERTITSNLVMRFQECYKTLVKCIYNLENFSGPDAKFFEDCSQSSKTTITMYEKNVDEFNAVQIGDADDSVLRFGSACKPGATVFPLLPAGDIGGTAAVSFFNNVMHYIAKVAAERNLVSGSRNIINVSSNMPEEE